MLSFNMDSRNPGSIITSIVTCGSKTSNVDNIEANGQMESSCHVSILIPRKKTLKQ